MSTVAGTTGTAGTGNEYVPTAKKTSELTDRNTFLKLMIAQLQNQNPLNPADGVQFMTQLAQFTSVEQNVQISQDMSAIRKMLEGQLGTGQSGSGQQSTTQAA